MNSGRFDCVLNFKVTFVFHLTCLVLFLHLKLAFLLSVFFMFCLFVYFYFLVYLGADKQVLIELKLCTKVSLD